MYSIVYAEEAKLKSSVGRLCTTLGVSRPGYYRWRQQDKPIKKNEPLRRRIRAIAGKMPGYGYRRITRQLLRENKPANSKRVRRIMREEGLQSFRKRRFVHTTNSKHGRPIYPNLGRKMALTAPNQLWVADITYVRLSSGFVYLAVILDAWSRKCIGWSLSRRIDTELAVAALQMALKRRKPGEGLVHHSDRGVQYASENYVSLLKANGIIISMSRKGNPYDNAKAESFMKTIKWEEVELMEYDNFEEAYERIDHFINQVYNQKRLHSALGYLPPVEFESNFNQVEA